MSKSVVLFLTLGLCAGTVASQPVRPDDAERNARNADPVPLSAPSGGVAQSPVARIWATSTGIVLVYPAGAVTGSPSCSAHSRFAIDTNTSGGRAMYQAVLVGYTMAGPLRFYGDGTCTLRGDSENLRDVLASTTLPAPVGHFGR